METEENIGYQDAIRQVQRSIQRRLKLLQEQLKDATAEKEIQLEARIDELHHVTQVIESLHR